MRPQKYLNLLLPVFNNRRTREILSVNPVLPVKREEATEVVITVFEFNPQEVREHRFDNVKECLPFAANDGFIHWINIDGLRKTDVEAICAKFGVHDLILEDILSVGQRPKMDEIEHLLYGLLNMLYFNSNNNTVEQEQISVVLGKNFVLSIPGRCET